MNIVLIIIFSSIISFTLYNQYKHNKRRNQLVEKNKKRNLMYENHQKILSIMEKNGTLNNLSIHSLNQDFNNIMNIDSNYYNTKDFH
jgi:hypothetical protein